MASVGPDGGIIWDDDDMQRALRTIRPRVRRAIAAAFVYHAPRAVAYAKQNAPWTDRTANARNGLFARVERTNSRGADGRFGGASSFALIISHGVPYGIWLEVRYSGRYAIIRPTVLHEAPEVMATAQVLVRRELER